MSELAGAVAAQVGALVRELRARDVRVGVGERLTAQRALAAADAASREDAYYALRAALCSSSADREVFADAFETVFGAGAPLALSPP